MGCLTKQMQIDRYKHTFREERMRTEREPNCRLPLSDTPTIRVVAHRQQTNNADNSLNSNRDYSNNPFSHSLLTPSIDLNDPFVKRFIVNGWRNIVLPLREKL